MSYGASCQGFLTVKINWNQGETGRSQISELGEIVWQIMKGTCHILSSKYFWGFCCEGLFFVVFVLLG